MIDINNLIKQAIKSKNSTELRAYKNLKAEIQFLQTAKNAKPYDESAEIQLISKMCKKLEEGISSFIEANREDLVSEYRDELEVLKKLLPEPVNESDIKRIFAQWFEEQEFGYKLGADKVLNLPKKEMGNAIKYLKSKFPQVDGKMISEIVKRHIS